MINKPENMTSLYGTQLVYKDHPRIILRGKLDSLQAKILKLQVQLTDKDVRLLEDLNEVLKYIRTIVRSEVLNEPLKDSSILGMEESEIRSLSHYPKKYLGIDHIVPNYNMGLVCIELNSIRCMVRETEVIAVNALRYTDRLDILRALNRLSSLIYVMTLGYLTGLYK